MSKVCGYTDTEYGHVQSVSIYMYAGVDTGFPEGGGDIHIACVTSSTLRKIDPPPPPTLGHSQAPPPPWTLTACRHQHSKGRFSGSGEVQGGDHPCPPPTPPPPPSLDQPLGYPSGSLCPYPHKCPMFSTCLFQTVSVSVSAPHRTSGHVA